MNSKGGTIVPTSASKPTGLATLLTRVAFINSLANLKLGLSVERHSVPLLHHKQHGVLIYTNKQHGVLFYTEET